MRFFACALWTLAASSAAIDIASSTDPLSSDVAAVASLGHSIDRRGGGGSSSRHTHSDHHGGKENTKHPHDAHHKNGDKDHNNSDKDNDKNDSNDDKNNKPSGHRGSTKDFSRKSINSFSLRAWGPWETTTKGDAIFVDLQFAPKSLAKRLKKMGKQVVCYISVGTVENFRADKTDFSHKELARKYKGFDGEETWLDITRWEDFKGVMSDRIKRSAKAGCTAMEYDNVDCFLNNCVKGASYGLLKKKQIEYIHWLLSEAHKFGLKAGLKNAMPIIKYFYDDMDFGINEECMQYNECEPYKKFASVGKVIFNVEYQGSRDSICKEAKRRKFLTKYRSKGQWHDCFDY